MEFVRDQEESEDETHDRDQRLKKTDIFPNRKSKFQNRARCLQYFVKLGCLRTQHKHFRMKWSLKCPQRQSPSCRFKVSHEWLKISNGLRATAAQAHIMLHPPQQINLKTWGWIHLTVFCFHSNLFDIKWRNATRYQVNTSAGKQMLSSVPSVEQLTRFLFDGGLGQRPCWELLNLWKFEAFQATDMASVQAKMQEPDLQFCNERKSQESFCRCLLCTGTRAIFSSESSESQFGDGRLSCRPTVQHRPAGRQLPKQPLCKPWPCLKFDAMNQMNQFLRPV